MECSCTIIKFKIEQVSDLIKQIKEIKVLYDKKYLSL